MDFKSPYHDKGDLPWDGEVKKLQALLEALDFSNGANRRVSTNAAFAEWCERTLAVRRRNSAIYLVGNGASAAMASHFAADLAKNAGLHTQVFFDAALLTAVSNDLGYENVFAEPLRRRGRAGDMLVAISSSGASPNILAAVGAARSLGIDVITITAMEPDNPLRWLGDLNAYVQAKSYSHAETCHAAILHHWIDLVLMNRDRPDSSDCQGTQSDRMEEIGLSFQSARDGMLGTRS